MTEQQMRLLNRGLTIEYVSLVWMIVECSIAISAGLMASSLALLAFGGDSVIELISSWTVLSYLRQRRTSVENVEENNRAEWITTILLFLLIPTIGFGMIYSYLAGIVPESSALGIGVAIAAVIGMPVLAVEKKRIGSAANLVPLSIDAIESWTCFYMSLALLGGLLMNYLWKVWWVDYVAAGVILVFVLREALEALEEIRS
ncbi:MAG: cation transporter [Candidatus Bathyarchaeia archaeon]